MPRDSANAIATEDLLKAYRLGYFPMARSREDASVVWVLPDERGVIPLDAAHVPKKLARFLKTEPFEIRINSAFTDLSYNVGWGAAARSTAAKRLAAGNVNGACYAVTWYNKAGGRVYQGLVNRRQDDLAVCRGDLSVLA